MMAEQLKTSLTSLQQYDINLLKDQWLSLEKKADNSIFTHWYFISTWLDFIHYNGNVLSVCFMGEIVGLAILCENSSIKKGIKINQLWLNRTGEPQLDQIWNEYNDILCKSGLEYSIRAAVIDFFEKELTNFDELIIGVSNENIKETPHSQQIIQHTSWQAISYQTQLIPEYQDWNIYLNTLSKNTRSQIKRSAKLFGNTEQIKIYPAKTADEAISFLSEAGELHKTRWKNQNSGFENTKFVEFHHLFIKQNFHFNIIDILKITAANNVICYLYNFKYKNTVYFYLSGIKYSNDNKLKPGLLSHSLAISSYAEQNYKCYDFMGGEGRYKASLSNKQGVLVVSNFRRKTIPFQISHLLKKIKAACE